MKIDVDVPNKTLSSGRESRADTLSNTHTLLMGVNYLPPVLPTFLDRCE